MKLNSVPELIEDIRQGKMVILMDDEDRENEGDLIMAASMVRPEDINFMATHARGLICMPMERSRCKQLNLPLMVSDNGGAHGTNFTLSIEATEGVTTGISAADRARTVQAAVKSDAKATDIVQPGHIFPLMAQPGGVLRRAGHTEAGCDLARLAGLEPAAAIVEIMNEDGTMARRPDLEVFAKEHDLKVGTIADLIQYRAFNEKTIERVSENMLPTVHGDFKCVTYRDKIDGQVHVAVIKGDIAADQVVTVRVHSVDPLRDFFGAKREGRAGWSIQNALTEIENESCGVVVVLGQDFSPDDLLGRMEHFFSGKREAGAMTAEGAGVYNTIGTGSQILRDLGVAKMRLLSSPMKFNALSGFDLEIVEYVNAEQ